MSERIFSLESDGALRALDERSYDSEALLQRLIADYPDLLSGHQMSPESPRRWLLVTRECGVPNEQGGADRFALDHLFLDQDAVPTLVEVKRSTDSRIRREVVGQMLDYAANAVAYWPVEHLRTLLEITCSVKGEDPSTVVASLLADNDEQSVDRFWTQVKTNLQAGRIRLVFVADIIPPELRRIVEFLNSQMDPAEVLALEVRQFVGERSRTLVPKIIGQTMAAQGKKSGRRDAGVKWTSTAFLSVSWPSTASRP